MAIVFFNRFFLTFIIVVLMTVLPLANGVCLDQVHHSDSHTTHGGTAISSCGPVLSAEAGCCLKHHECPSAYSETIIHTSPKPLSLPDYPVFVEKLRVPQLNGTRVSSKLNGSCGIPMVPLSTSRLILRI